MRAVALATILTLSAGAAGAQSMCAPYAQLSQAFNSQGIRLEGGGIVPLSEGTGAAEIWVAPDGTWAIITILPNGVACMALSGENWTTPEPA